VEEDGYEMRWVGKREAYHTAFLPTQKILNPLIEDSKNWDSTGNLLLRGDNLEALRLLRHSYFGKIKLIYIDPPYNTKSDAFIYNDDFSTKQTQILAELGYDKDNIDYIKNIYGAKTHSGWLSFMYPRLLLAKDLLRDDGVIFISIDDNEQAQLKLLCDEVFGEENFISQLVWEKKKKGTFLSNQIASVKEYILVYFKNKANAPSLIAEINTEIETYPCINPSNKRGERTFKSGMISKYRNKNIALPENTKISVSTMDIIYKNGLVIENGKLINDVIAEGNWRYSQELIDEYNENGDLYFTEDLYIT
jgi:adenine-specific DNA-methyltransferase